MSLPKRKIVYSESTEIQKCDTLEYEQTFQASSVRLYAISCTMHNLCLHSESLDGQHRKKTARNTLASLGIDLFKLKTKVNLI